MLPCPCQVALPLLYHVKFVVLGQHSKDAFRLSCCFASCVALPLSYCVTSAMLCCLYHGALPLSCCLPWLDGFGFVIPCCLCYVELSLSRCVALSWLLAIVRWLCLWLMLLCHCRVALPLSYRIVFVVLYCRSCEAIDVMSLFFHCITWQLLRFTAMIIVPSIYWAVLPLSGGYMALSYHVLQPSC